MMEKGLKVLFEDNHLIAVEKQAGWLVQGDETGDTPLSEYVKQYIKIRYGKPGDVFLGIVHRLDRPVSGVVIFARTSKALTRMNNLFRDREIQKTYFAITRERPDPPSGKLSHFLAKNRVKNQARIFNHKPKKWPDAKIAELEYELIASLGAHHMLKVIPHTGRPHQIRVQLAGIGCPIRGDLKYGDKSPNNNGSIHLHAFALSFIHPVRKEPVVIKNDPPNDSVWRNFREHWEDFQIDPVKSV